jgi:ribosomal protein S2
MLRNIRTSMQHKIATRSSKLFERVKQYRYLGTVLTNENYIHEKIKGRL